MTRCYHTCLINTLLLMKNKCHKTLQSDKNDRHAADNVWKCLFLQERYCILSHLSLHFVHVRRIKKVDVISVAPFTNMV